MSASLIGGLGLTRVRVYGQRPAPDGLHGGSPHIHAITDEAYYVTSGRGRVEMHDELHGFRSLPLEPGTYVDFEPCVLHRLVSEDRLEVLGMMGNAGLAESGDARIYFGADVDADPEAYAALWTLPKRRGLEGALERRDRAVAAYARLVGLWTANRPAYFAELSRFVRVALAAAAERRDQFAIHIAQGPLAAGERTRSRLERLPEAASERVVRIQAEVTTPALGMCGELFTVLRPEPPVSAARGLDG